MLPAGHSHHVHEEPVGPAERELLVHDGRRRVEAQREVDRAGAGGRLRRPFLYYLNVAVEQLLPRDRPNELPLRAAGGAVDNREGMVGRF
eukprot:SAG22_NODE_136_length_18095_cov_19.897255_31_plen_90_part_00